MSHSEINQGDMTGSEPMQAVPAEAGYKETRESATGGPEDPKEMGLNTPDKEIKSS